MRQALDKISTQILRYIPFVLSFFVPLFFLPFTTDFFAFNKFFLLALIASVSLIAWSIRNLTRGKLHFTSSPAVVPLMFLVIVNIVSSLWISPTKQTSLLGQTSLFTSLTIIFITVTASQKNLFTIKSAIYGLIASTTLISLYTIANYAGLVGKITTSTIFANRYFNLTGSILPALSVTIPVLVATTLFTTKLKNWILKATLFASVLVMIAASIINVSLLLPQSGVPTISILPFRAGWSIAVDTMKTWQTALFGTGPETYFSAFTRLRPAFLNLDKYFWNVRFSESSSYLLTLLTTTGILGGLSFLAAFLRPLMVSLKARQKVEEKAVFSFLLTALVITVISFFVIPTGVVTLSLGILLLICLTIALKLDNHSSVKDVTLSLSANTQSIPSYHDIPETASSTITSSFLPWFVTFLAVALLSVFWFLAGKTYFASVSYQQATQIAKDDPYSSFLKYQKAAQMDTNNPYYLQKMSQIYLAIANSYLTKEDGTDEDKKNGTDFAQRALDAAKISAQNDPLNVTVWENLASIYRTLVPYAQGSADMAISHSLQALNLDPTNPSIYLQLGTLFYNFGDADQAIKYMDRTIELKQNWDLPYYNLTSIYRTRKEYAKALQYARAGLQYTDPKSTDLPTIQDEIKALEKLAPAAAATSSATTN